jgi:predicted nucleic acid-binding protein
LGLEDFLRENRGSTIAIDTMIFIYLFEEDKSYIDSAMAILESVEKGKLKAVTSTVAVIECLTKPLKKDDFPLVAKYKTAFLNFPNLEVVSISIEVAEKAASIRARYGLKTLDSIQIAVGVLRKVKTFLTNDLDFKEIETIKVIQLSNLLKKDSNIHSL